MIQKERRCPNLFILGAPKCGTTAMSSYLAGHPDVFMSEQGGLKEPKFFCSDIWYSFQQHPRTWEEYLEVFRSAPETAKYWGEATPRYLLSKEAVPKILKANSTSKFIVMLRNPVDLVVSQHNENVKCGREDRSFEEAWRLQEERLRGRCLPKGITEGHVTQLATRAMLGQQLQYVYGKAKLSQVHVIFYEDFKRDPALCYRELLRFLELPDDGRKSFQKINQSVLYKSNRIETLLKNAGKIRNKLGLPGIGIHRIANRFNKCQGKEVISADLKRELHNYFKDDVNLLSSLTRRELSHWYAE